MPPSNASIARQPPSRRMRYWRIVLACLVSGILAGLLTASQCQISEDCRIGAIQVLSSDPASWTMWLHWINWVPGIVFGLLFAFSALERDRADRPRRVGLYALASGAAYLIAGLVFALFLSPAAGVEYGLIVWVWPAGIAAGLIGALVLAVMCNLLIRPASAGGPFSRSWLPALVGAVAGVLFVYIGIYGEQQILLAWPAAFVIWQVAVGVALLPRSA